MDPGLLVLGALSVGATAALKFFKRKEGFELLPNQQYQKDIAEKQSQYNIFTLSSNPLTTAQANASLTPAQQKSLQNTVDDIFKTSKVISTGPNQIQLGQAENPYPAYIPAEDSEEGLATFCQKTPITNSVFNDAKFAKHCGVCINGGTLMDGQKFTGTKGLFIRSSAKDTAIEEKQRSGSTFVNAAPSVGSCTGASSTAGIASQYTFAVTNEDYLSFMNRMNCMKNQVLTDSCATCVQDGSYTYTGNHSQFETDLVFFLSGTGSMSVSFGAETIYFANGIQSPSSATSASTSIQLQETMPIRISASLKEGTLVQITVNETEKNKTNLFGVLQVPLGTGGYTSINLDKIVFQDDESGTKPRRGRFYKSILVGSERIDSPILVPAVGKSKMLLSGSIPFVSPEDFPFEGIDCKGSILQTKPESVARFGGDPCYKPSGQGPGTWSDACLQNRILSVGCTDSGDLFKNPTSLKSLSLSQIIQNLQTVASTQFTEKVASKQCTGKDLSTPCDSYINWNPDETGSISPQCLSFLYKNEGDGKPMIGPTYTGPVNTFFSLDANGKKQFCLPTTTLNPTSSRQTTTMYQNLATNGYKGNFGIKAVQLYMNDIYNRATNTGLNANLPDSRGGRLNSIQSCYGNVAAIPDTPQPSTKYPKARYVRIRFPYVTRDPIQISQLAVYDNRNINVAQGKPTTAANKLANDCGPEKAVDGQLASRWHPGEYHSTGSGSDWWQVDLLYEYPIAKIVYYNRGDCCQNRSNGMLIEALDVNKNITYSTSLSGKRMETFVPFLAQYNI